MDDTRGEGGKGNKKNRPERSRAVLMNTLDGQKKIGWFLVADLELKFMCVGQWRGLEGQPMVSAGEDKV